MPATEFNNVVVLERALRHFADPARREHYFDLYDPAVVWHGYGGVTQGLETVKQYYADIWSAFPDARVNIEEVFTAEDKVVLRFVMTGTHQGLFNDIPATGNSIALPGITILRFANGKCVERWSQADFLSVLGQLGALPA